MKQKMICSNRGFTLMEILLVVVIIGILAAAVLPQLTKQLPFVQKKRAEQDIATISSALDRYYMQNNDYPTTDQGLKALIEKPSSAPIPKNWVGPYVKKQPMDPWQNEYKYKCPGDHNPDEYDLWSTGKLPTDDSDDICNWEKKSTTPGTSQ
jgi:general secretion pathway protein G